MLQIGKDKLSFGLRGNHFESNDMSKLRRCADVILYVIFKAKRQHKVVDNVFVTSIFGNNFVKDEVIRKYSLRNLLPSASAPWSRR